MRNRSLLLTLALVLVIATFAGWVAWPGNPGINLRLGTTVIERDVRVVQGLDLQGGIQVLLEAEPPEGQAVTPEAMEAAKAIIDQRVNALGVAEPVIQLQGERRIVVELPGLEDEAAAIQLFGETGLLEFIDVGDTPPAAGTRLAEGQYPTILTGKNLRSSEVGFDEFRRPQINFQWDSEGAGIFSEHTKDNIGRFLAITMDKVVLSTPVINDQISDSGRITGQFSLEEARRIVIQLKYGALPIPMKIVQQRSVGAILGQDSVEKSIVAGSVGLALVAAFMLIYYRLPGLLAVVALAMYAVVVFALFKLIPVVLTLAGIAGFVLSIGMAVDANILIFERLKEELRAGHSLRSALEAGFARAWTSIRDSNLATLITCAILFWFGTGIIKGFALTLAIGVLVSMFTAITATRTLLRLLVRVRGSWPAWAFGISTPPAPATEHPSVPAEVTSSGTGT